MDVLFIIMPPIRKEGQQAHCCFPGANFFTLKRLRVFAHLQRLHTKISFTDSLANVEEIGPRFVSFFFFEFYFAFVELLSPVKFFLSQQFLVSFSCFQFSPALFFFSLLTRQTLVQFGFV